MTLPEILLIAMAVEVIAQPAAAMEELRPRMRLPHCGSPWRKTGVPSFDVGNLRPSSSRTGPEGPVGLLEGSELGLDGRSKLSPELGREPLRPGMVSCWPTRIRFGLLMWFALARAFTEVPYRLASALRVSPLRTVCVPPPRLPLSNLSGMVSRWPTRIMFGLLM